MGPDLTTLNASQREAVLHGETPLLVLAGAGTGKTSVITHRIAHLVQSRQVWASKILAVTFTNKAAREMRERVERLIGSEAATMQIGTFHRQSGLLLRRYGDRLGLSPSFAIYDADDQLQLVRQCLQALQIDPQVCAPRAVRQIIEGWKNSNLAPGDVRAASSELLEQRGKQVYELYQKRLRDTNAVDFSDMLRQAAVLLRDHEDVRLVCQQRWSHLLVDEYQDTNPVQYAWLRQLVTSAHSLTVVGDDDQSIYRWRGADIGNILRFERDFPGAHVIRLEENYRSTNTILQAANHVIGNNAARKGKTLFSQRGDGAKLWRLLFDTERDEAEAIAEKIRRDRSESAGESVAILYRTNGQSRPLEEALRRRQLPYSIVGGIRFYDRKEVKDALSYLRLLTNEHSDLDFLRVVNVPARGLGKTSLDKLLAYAQLHGLSLGTASAHMGANDAFAQASGLTARAKKALGQFADQLAQLRREMGQGVALAELLGHTLQATGYLVALKQIGGEQNDERVRNLEELSQALDEYQATHQDAELTGFLQEAALVTDVDSLAISDAPGVMMMTLHAAKGLEFAHVFLPGLEEGLLPHSRSLDSRAELEEERRLCYVGITRAQKTLMLSAARVRSIFGRVELCELSRFWHEVPDELVMPPPDELSEQRGGAFGATAELPDGQSQAYADGASYAGGPQPRARRPRPLAAGIIAAQPIREASGMVVGQRVLHATFGEGPIVAVEGDGARTKVTVAFPRWGKKVVVARFVTPLSAG